MARHTITLDLSDEQEQFIQWYAKFDPQTDTDAVIRKIFFDAANLLINGYKSINSTED